MELIDALRREHELIERVALSLRAFVRRDDCTAADARVYIRFFGEYAGAWHHEREEDVLFPRLTDDLLLPADRGPIAVLVGDHHRMSALLGQMRDAAAHNYGFDAGRFRDLGLEYSQSLLLHIDAENSVLFPECDDRLRRAGITEIACRELTPDESGARGAGESIAELYPPAVNDPDLARGDGCVMCASFGASCSGIEREWWNEWEWEEFDEHVASS